MYRQWKVGVDAVVALMIISAVCVWFATTWGITTSEIPYPKLVDWQGSLVWILIGDVIPSFMITMGLFIQRLEKLRNVLLSFIVLFMLFFTFSIFTHNLVPKQTIEASAIYVSFTSIIILFYLKTTE